MYFLGSTSVTIRKAFKRKQDRAEDLKEKYKLAKKEFDTIAKLGVIMGILKDIKVRPFCFISMASSQQGKMTTLETSNTA